MSRDQLFERIRHADPAPLGAAPPEVVWTATALLKAIDQRSGDMQTHDEPITEDGRVQRIERETEPRTPSPGPSRRRGLLVAAAAVVVAIIAAGVVIGLLGGSSDEPDVGSLTPGPISSFEDIAGTYLRHGPDAPTYFLLLSDGTFHTSSDRDLVVDRPQAVFQTRFEGTEVFITTTSSFCDQPDQGGTYEIRVLENGNLQFVALDDDTCATRSGFFLGLRDGVVTAEYEPVP